MRDLLTFPDLWERLLQGDESIQIEAKRAEEIGKSVVETVSAFANEPGAGGGYLLLGVARPTAAAGYRVVGVPDAEKVQNDLATQCSDMLSAVIRPTIAVEHVGGKNVVVAFIPEAQLHEKPVYIKSRGLPGGAFRRIGASDQRCTEEDIALFYQLRNQSNYEDMALSDASLDDFEYRAIAEYRRLRKEVNPGAVELGYGDEDLLLSVGAVSRYDGRLFPTAAGLILFGTSFALRRYFPMFRVDYVRTGGREWVEDPEKRYESVNEFREPLILLAPNLIRHITDELPKAFALSPDGIFRQDIPEIPYAVDREAIVNALMHQNVRTAQPTLIIRYTSRLEIRNPGASLVPVDRLGHPGSWPRNPRIAAVMHDLALAESKGTGIRIMREGMERANLTVPLFDSDRVMDRFAVTLLTHHFLGEDDITWLSQFKDCSLSDDEVRALIVARENGAINNAMYRDVCGVDTLTASRHLQRLRDLELLEQKGKSSGTYYVPGKRSRDSIDNGLPMDLNSTGKEPDSIGNAENSSENAPLQLPGYLLEAVKALGKRARPERVRDVIFQLCSWQPLAATQIASILGRHQVHLLNAYLRPMLQEGVLHYTHPENPNHPLQAYRTQIDLPSSPAADIKEVTR